MILSRKQQNITKRLKGFSASFMVIVLIGLLTTACGGMATPNLTLTTTNGGSAGAESGDPYAGLSHQQVMDTYLKAYQQGNFDTCRALLSKDVLAGWTSPNELQVQAQEKQYGKLEVKIFGLLSDQGSTVTYLVQYTRIGGEPTPTAQRLIPASPLAPTATPAGAPTPTPVVRSGNFELRRENNAWKISNYTVI